MASTEPLAFVSYRRVDSSHASRWLADSIARTFGAQSVFIDTESIRASNDWAEKINQALASATLLIPVIGHTWLSTADENSQRRIDIKNDWVRNEIRHAIRSKISILPVLVSKAAIPKPNALPEPIRDLARYQGFELRDDRWANDLQLLLTQMQTLGFVRLSGEEIRYPTPMLDIRELSVVELQDGLRHLPAWKTVVSDIPGMPGRQRCELHRKFEFASFLDAIAFMERAAPEIDRRDHHPRWQNLWCTVSVSLTTWDIGHKPSRLDLELAAYLDALRTQFPASSD